MVFRYKLNYYKSEDGEYTADAACDKALIEKIIADHWTGEQLPNGLELIVVWNDVGQTIMLEHSAKEVFEVYYLPLQGYYLYHKKSRIDLIYDTLTAFMDNDIHWLDNNLNKTTYENKRIRKDVLTQSFIYEVTPQRLWSAIGMTLAVGLTLGVLFIVIWIGILIKATHSSGIIFMTILTAIITWLWLPGVFLHFQYKKENDFLFLRLSRGEEVLWVDVGGSKKEFLKSDIASIERMENPAYKLSWADYGYTTLTFHSGEIVIITNLMIDQWLLAEKFPEHRISKTNSRFPWIKKHTSLQMKDQG